VARAAGGAALVGALQELGGVGGDGLAEGVAVVWGDAVAAVEGANDGLQRRDLGL
jgi:hypothetical protein